MIVAIFKSIAVVSLLVLSLIGVATSASVIGLVTGRLDLSQVTLAIQDTVDHINYCFIGYAGSTVLATLRAVRPYAVERMKAWITEVVLNAAGGR